MTTIVVDPETDKTASAARRFGDRDSRSPRDVRRTWAELLPRTAVFRHPYARLLAEWACAILHDDSWEAFVASHPDGIDLDPEMASGR